MRELKRAAFDEILPNGLKRQHSLPQIIGDLLQAEIAEKQARSIKYQVAIARLPLAKELSDFDFSDTPINEGLARDLATGSFLQNQRNAVLVGGTGTGKSHLAVAIARACIRTGARGPSIPRSTWSTGWSLKPAPGGRAVSPIASPGSTFLFSTSSVICRSPNPAASCCSTWSAGSTSKPRSLSPPISLSPSGLRSSATLSAGPEIIESTFDRVRYGLTT